MTDTDRKYIERAIADCPKTYTERLRFITGAAFVSPIDPDSTYERLLCCATETERVVAAREALIEHFSASL